jgi:integrase
MELGHAKGLSELSVGLYYREERYVRELPAPIVRSRPGPNAIAPPLLEHDIVSATPKRRRKGPCMSRRRGQTGYVWQKNQNGNQMWDTTAAAYGQVWVDVPGKERQRKFYQLGVCRTRSEAKRRLKEMIERDGINSTVEIAQSIDSVTFDQQAEWWIKAIEDGRVLHRRKRTRIKPATIDGYKCAISWLSPHIGKTPLANIKNAAAKELVANMKQAGLSDKTIVSYFQVLQSVIASVVNDEGEQVHPRTWDSHFIGLPVVNPKKQNRPTRTAKEIEKIIAASRNRYRVLYSLLAGTGLRIGEALALKIGQHISDNCSTGCRPGCGYYKGTRSLACQVHWRPQEWLLVLHGERQTATATQHSSRLPAPYFSQAQRTENGIPLFQALPRIRAAEVGSSRSPRGLLDGP